MKVLNPEDTDSLKTLSFAGHRLLNPAAQRWLSAILLLAFGLTLACGTTAASASEFQSGSYSGTRPRGDKVVLKFDDKGKFTLTDEDGNVLVEGSYKTTKEKIEFTDTKGPMASKDAKPGKYKWKLEAKTLNFTKVEDESDGRSKGLTGTAWILEK